MPALPPRRIALHLRAERAPNRACARVGRAPHGKVTPRTSRDGQLASSIWAGASMARRGAGHLDSVCFFLPEKRESTREMGTRRRIGAAAYCYVYTGYKSARQGNNEAEITCCCTGSLNKRKYPLEIDSVSIQQPNHISNTPFSLSFYY